MAKQDSPCLFCGAIPCECDGSAPKKKSRSSKTRTATSTKSKSTSPSVTTGSASESAFDTIPKLAKSTYKPPKPTDGPDLEYLSALSALRPILSGEELRRIDRLINPPYPQELDRRIAAWRKRNEA